MKKIVIFFFLLRVIFKKKKKDLKRNKFCFFIGFFQLRVISRRYKGRILVIVCIFEMVGSVNIDQQGKGGYVSDEVLGTFIPIVVYWVYSGLYLMLGNMDNYRLHSKKDEDEKNLVSKKEVVKGVLLQQIVQAAVATVLFAVSYFDHL